MLQVLIVVVLFIFEQSDSFGVLHSYHHPKHRPTLKIINGTVADISDHPYQVSVEYYNDHYCGGVILSKHFVATAAHCTYWAQAGVFHVRAGSSRLESGGQRILAKKKYEHPNFSHWTYDNDLCLLELVKPLEFSNTVRPVSLPTPNWQSVVGSVANVSGWGSVKDEIINTTHSPRLRAADVPIVDDDVCRQSYIKILPVTERMLCAGGNGKDACHGDSGGPLVQNDTLIGIVSWGRGCAKSYGVYTRVSKLRSFIDHYIQEDA